MATYTWKGKDRKLYSYNNTSETGIYLRDARKNDKPGRRIRDGSFIHKIESRSEIPKEYLKLEGNRGIQWDGKKYKKVPLGRHKMKRRIMKRRKDGVKQHYIVGKKKRRSFGSKGIMWDDVDDWAKAKDMGLSKEEQRLFIKQQKKRKIYSSHPQTGDLGPDEGRFLFEPAREQKPTSLSKPKPKSKNNIWDELGIRRA